MLTVENESAESAIRVVRQYVRWRSPNGSSVPTDFAVNELATSRSVKMLSVDLSGQPAQRTKPDRFRRPEPLPYFNILVATDGMISLYRVLCQRSAQEEILSSSPDDMDSPLGEASEDSIFTWVFSLKAQATHIGLCDAYLSYTTTTEAFLMHISVDQVSLEEHSLSRICETSIDAIDTDRPKLQHHSTVLSTTSLLRVKEASGSRKGSISRSSSFASIGVPTPTGSPSVFTGAAGEPKGLSSSRGSVGPSSRNTLSASDITPVENSKHHFDIVFDRSNAVKDRAPYVELSLDKLTPQIVGPQGPSLGGPMTPASGVPTNLGEIVGPHHDVHSYVVNTDDDFQLSSSQLLFYRNFQVTKASLDADFLVMSGNVTPAEADAIVLNSLSLSPIVRTPDAPPPPNSTQASPPASLASSMALTESAAFYKPPEQTPVTAIIQGVKLFVGCAQKGYLWMFKKQDLCETVTYEWPSECHDTIVTDNFVFALSQQDTAFIAQMRQFDPLHSGNKFCVMSGENNTPKATEKESKARTSIGHASTAVVIDTRCKTLIQQKSKPPLVGALSLIGITHICVEGDGKILVLCKSTADSLRALRDSSLPPRPGKQRSGSSSQNLNATKADSPSLHRRNVAEGWNIVTNVFNGPQAMIEQLKTWTSPDRLSKDDWDILIEFWTLTIAVSRSYLKPENPLEISRWATADDHKVACLERRSILSAMAQLEYEAKRLMRASVMWSLSDLPADQATHKLMQKLKTNKVDGTAKTAQAACEELLKRVLLGPTQRMDLIESGSKGFADVVYAILVHQNAPLVGQAVLESPLSNFELDTTIILLEQTMSTLERKSLSGVDMAQSFLENAIVLDLDGEVESKSPLNDFWKGQTQEDKQLWMTTLALVVLMLKRDESEETLVARRNGSFKGSLSLTTPDSYLFKLPGAFLVPYLTTHSHLMFEAQNSSPSSNLASSSLSTDSSAAMDEPVADTSSKASESPSAPVPSRLAHLLSQTLPWVCLEILAVGGPSIFPIDYSTGLLSGNGYTFSWIVPGSAPTTMDANSVESAPSSTGSLESLKKSTHQLQEAISGEKNPTIITTYYEALLLPTLNPAPKNVAGMLASNSQPASSLTTFGTSPLKRNLGSTSSPNTPALPDVAIVEALASRYLALSHLSPEEVTQLLEYTSSDWILRMNPHNTNPPLSLEGIWKEFHHEYLLESRYKFIASVLPVYPPPKGTLSTQGIPEWFYVIKLHGLLCALTTLSLTHSAFTSPLKHIANHIMREVKVSGLPDRVVDSVVLLCQPVLGDFEDTVLQLTLLHPTSLIKFLKRYLPKGEMAKWKVTLQVLLAQIAKAETKESVWCLQETLTYMARNLPSTDFLNLLPDNGNVAFFIPYIELNLGRNASMNLLTEIQAVK